MTQRAICLRVGTETLGSLRLGVLKPSFLRVTARATCGRHGADFLLGQLVALRAFDVLFHDVHAMAGRRARRSPGELNVDAATERARARIRVRARSEYHDGHGQHGERQ